MIDPIVRTRAAGRSHAPHVPARAHDRQLAAPPRATRVRRAGPKGRPDARRRFELLERRFIPGKAKGLKLVVQDDLTGPGGGTWTVKVADGKVRVRAGAATDPDVRYASSVDDYCRLDDGTLDPLRAFLTGRVKIAGDRTAMRRYTGAFRPIDDVL